MRRKLVVGNWKMHGSIESVDTLLSGLSLIDAEAVSVAVCPPFVFIPAAISALENTDIAVGSQNVSAYDQGAYTGEISAGMLSQLGCKYAIIGHSERRDQWLESDQQLAAKFVLAQAKGLVPILCLGESLDRREAGDALAFVESQLRSIVDIVGVGSLSSAVIAYEPVWAIGTGKTASPGQAQEMHAHVRGILASLDGSVAEKVQILYGGSVNAVNAAELFSQQDIDGALVGGASLKIDDFSSIVAAAKAAQLQSGG